MDLDDPMLISMRVSTFWGIQPLWKGLNLRGSKDFVPLLTSSVSTDDEKVNYANRMTGFIHLTSSNMKYTLENTRKLCLINSVMYYRGCSSVDFSVASWNWFQQCTFAGSPSSPPRCQSGTMHTPLAFSIKRSHIRQCLKVPLETLGISWNCGFGFTVPYSC